jgi:hypothetical protein
MQAMWTRNALVVLVTGVLAVSSCAVSEERGGPGADGISKVLVACTEDEPDCQDTVVDDGLVTGGDDPVAPTPGSNASASSGMVIEALSITEALSYQGSEPIAVEGYIVRTSVLSQLCEALAESYPPQCGGESITITNPDATDAFPLVEERDLQWSPELVTVVGAVTPNGLTIDPAST